MPADEKGLCECGCGKPTRIATRDQARYGHVKGQPVRFVPGHQWRQDRKEADYYRVEDRGYSTHCWTWQFSINRHGYALIKVKNSDGTYQTKLAHRVFYERHLESIPSGLTIDHLCRNRECVNPAHMEPVSVRENVLRGEGITAQNARKTHCLNGHSYDEANTYVSKGGGRQCRACTATRARKRRAAQKEAA